MAERRMFAKSIVLSDRFLDMSLGARCLYMTMGMVADDDGFVNSPKSIMRQIGASEDDLKVLIVKKFVIPFESGVVVIKHWRINNYLRNDRYHETTYTDEKGLLQIEDNGAYGIPNNGIPSIGKDSIGKDSIGKDIKSVARFTKPTRDELLQYCNEKQLTLDVDRFLDYYESNGWKVGRTPMKDWKRTARNWSRKDSPPKKEERRLSATDEELVREVTEELWR